MKLLCPVLIALVFSITTAKAEIKNGYLDINNARVALKNLTSTLSSDTLTPQQTRKVKENIRLLTEHILYFELTETLISQFRMISPALYDEVSALQDRNGMSTDVFIKFIPKENTDIQHPGATYIKYKNGDNTCYSEYGAHTVSVKIWIMDISLTILAHELGHVKYEVPNLAAYDEYHETNYRSQSSEPNYIGHNPSDPSGQSSFSYQKRFSADYRNHARTSSTKVPSPQRMMNEIQKAKRELTGTPGTT